MIADAQYALDLVFSAGTLATPAGVARSDSGQYAYKLQDGKYKEALGNAKIWLKSTDKKIGEIELNNHEFLRYWLGEDARVLQMAKEFIKQVKNEMKRSYTLTKTKAANPKGLGVKPKKPGYSASAYPALPATLEETAESGPSRTETWVQKAKHNLEKKPNVGGKTEKVTTNDMTGQPPDYNQSVGWQPFMPQYNIQLQYGFQASSAGQGQYPVPMLHLQTVFMPPTRAKASTWIRWGICQE